MTLEEMLARLPTHLKQAVKSVKLSPALGFKYPARFETLLDAEVWIRTEVARAYRTTEPVQCVSLSMLVRHAAHCKPVVLSAIRDALKDS